jgi:hypothetical protein
MSAQRRDQSFDSGKEMEEDDWDSSSGDGIRDGNDGEDYSDDSDSENTDDEPRIR